MLILCIKKNSFKVTMIFNFHEPVPFQQFIKDEDVYFKFTDNMFLNVKL